MNLKTWIACLLISAAMACSPSVSRAQAYDAKHDSEIMQRLYREVSEHYKHSFVEVSVGQLKSGGRLAKVVLTDSVAFHADPAAQRAAAEDVAEYVRQLLATEDLETIRIGWKYAPRGGMGSAVTYDFRPADLRPAKGEATPS